MDCPWELGDGCVLGDAQAAADCFSQAHKRSREAVCCKLVTHWRPFHEWLQEGRAFYAQLDAEAALTGDLEPERIAPNPDSEAGE